MEQITEGKLAAKRQTWKESNPRALLRRIREENPNASKSALLRQFISELRDEENENYLLVALEYVFDAAWNASVKPADCARPRRSGGEVSASKAIAVAAASELKAAIKEAATRMVLLDLEMPNGKALRDCTGKECKRIGGWLVAVAAAVKPGDVIGAVLSEAQVRRLYGK